MDKRWLRIAKKTIHKCLTQDFKHGRRKNQRIFDPVEGYACYNGTDLEMVMDKVVLGLYLTLNQLEREKEDGNRIGKRRTGRNR